MDYHNLDCCYYWGKSSKSSTAESAPYHLLVYHCLDVAAVASYWWDNAPALRAAFSYEQTLSEQQIKAWLLFFIALHDVGKFDIRFQCKSLHSWLALHPEDEKIQLPDATICRLYNHGASGLHWLIDDYKVYGEPSGFDFFTEAEPHPYDSWIPWIEAITGHHGYILRQHQRIVANLQMPMSYAASLAQRDKKARLAWISILESLFLKEQGLSVDDLPPRISPLMAGFCSVADWLGSWRSEDTFHYCEQPPANTEELHHYFIARQQHDALRVLERSGLLASPLPYGGVETLLDSGHLPRQLQVLVDQLPVAQGVTLIEAPTGSGKTETALACSPRQRG